MSLVKGGCKSTSEVCLHTRFIVFIKVLTGASTWAAAATTATTAATTSVTVAGSTNIIVAFIRFIIEMDDQVIDDVGLMVVVVTGGSLERIHG